MHVKRRRGGRRDIQNEWNIDELAIFLKGMVVVARKHREHPGVVGHTPLPK